MHFPWRDAQFWIVTAIFIAALLYLFRSVIPIPGRAKGARGERKATLTISAKSERTPAQPSPPSPPRGPSAS